MIRRLLPKSEFTRNVLTLMTGTTIAQAIPIAITPILTRIYTPEDYGVFAMYTAIISIISVIATGRYELAIILPRKESDGANIVVLSVVIAAGVSLLMLLVVWLFNTPITQMLGNTDISTWLYLTPISVFLTGIYQSLNYWNTRKNKYKRLAANRVLQSGSTAVSNLVAGLIGMGFGGLVFSGFIGQAISTGILANIFIKEDKNILLKVKLSKEIALAKKYKNFPLINSLHAFLDSFKNGISLLFISKIYGVLNLGYFSLMEKVLFTPMRILGTSFTQVYYSEAAEYYRHKKCYANQTKKLMIKLFLIGLIPFLIINIFSDQIFHIAFGEKWAEAGKIAHAYSVYVLFHFVASPISVIPLICNREAEAFIWNFIGSAIYSLSIIICSLFQLTLFNALLCLSISMAIYFSTFYWRAIQMTKWAR
ncbi:oligosaccharide flippase family protein [Anabaena sphaerica FACHB-251]|uniref:Oligosaccharide flippase family protein n=1 Tax=Anabaena sphaerica FACHB-251 TaxID=2692883 RepID=A0A926WCK5_9NOST|nr:oligosaccharide flippase family protein [Anabaena sphaerica]MBD2292141.1 oligosaccharide flippase family protein [Anabaena sphaerica FACHB-251]